MNGQLFSGHRLVVCRRCGRSVAAGAHVCPHCDHRRLSRSARARRQSQSVHASANSLHHALISVPLRILVGCVLLTMTAGVYS